MYRVRNRGSEPGTFGNVPGFPFSFSLNPNNSTHAIRAFSVTLIGAIVYDRIPSEMSQELEVLKIVAKRLQEADIPYMVTGSVAASFYAIPRMTRDIDMVIAVESRDIDRLLALFKNDFYIDRDSITEAIDQRGMFNLIHNESIIKVDLIVRKDSPYRKTEFERRQKFPLKDFEIWIVRPEDLILSKLFWAKESLSEMQLGDVKNLLLSVKNLDTVYLRHWVESLHLQEIYEKVKP